MLTHVLSRESFLSRYPFLPLLLSLCSGISLQSATQLQAAPCLLLTAFTWCMAVVLHLRRSATRRPLLRIAVMLISFNALGASLSALQDIRHHQNWYGHYLQKATALTVYIEEAPQVKERTLLLPVSIKSIKTDDHWIQVKGALRLYVYRKEGMPVYHSGQTLLIPAQLLPIKNSGNPFAFDYAAYAARQGWYHQAFLPAAAIHVLKTEEPKQPLIALRHKLQQRIAANVPDSTTRALIEATLLNERSSLDEELWKAYSVTGIVHIIAISGMHIAMLAGMLLFVLRPLPFPRLKQLKYFLAIIAIWCYVALTGFPPSAVRAALMFTLMAIGIILDKTSAPVNTWAAAGFLLLCFKPHWLYDIGLQLSFLAVLSLLLFYKPIERWYQPRSLWWSRIWRVVAVSIAVQVLVAPLVIYYFHQFPVMGLVANVPAAFFSTLLMYGGTGLLLLSFANLPGLWLGKLLTWLTHSFHWLIRLLADHTPQTMQQLYIDRYEYWLIMSAIVAICLLFRYRRQFYYYATWLLVFFLIVDFIAKDALALRQEHIVVYNVSRTSLADIYKGKHTIAINSTTTSSKITSYTLLPARLALRAAMIQQAIPAQLYRIEGATVLFLNASRITGTTHHFSVDFLVISHQCIFDPEAWYHTFHPKKIIMDSSLPRWKALQWKQKLERLGAQVHWVQEDGAWVFPALPT